MLKFPTDDAYLYERPYFDGYYLNDKRREGMYRQEYERIIRRKDFGCVLDIGCGVGGFLETFDDRWDKWGYEPSDFAANKAKTRGVKIVPSLDRLDSSSFDLIIFRGTLQHINFPMATLAHATQLLKPGGLLVILATPDTDSLVYKVWGNLPPLDAPRNWILFGSKMLANILTRLGYTDIEVLHPYWETPYARPLKDFWQFFVSLLFGYRKFAFPGNMMEVYAVKK